MSELLTMSFIPGIMQKVQVNQQLILVVASTEAVLFILVILFLLGRNKHKKRSFHHELAGFMEEGDADIGSRIINIDSRLDLLVDKVKSVLTQLASIEEQMQKITDCSGNNRSGAPKKSQAEVLKIYENIYRAYDSGVRVNELSRKFGRSSGEIELILNIRKVQSR